MTSYSAILAGGSYPITGRGTLTASNLPLTVVVMWVLQRRRGGA